MFGRGEIPPPRRHKLPLPALPYLTDSKRVLNRTRHFFVSFPVVSLQPLPLSHLPFFCFFLTHFMQLAYVCQQHVLTLSSSSRNHCNCHRIHLVKQQCQWTKRS